MNRKKLKTKDYTIQIVSPSVDNKYEDKPRYLLREKGAVETHEFSSAECLLKKITALGHGQTPSGPQEGRSKPKLKPSEEAELLKILIKTSYSKLRQLRFAMTDRITSAMTRVTMLKVGRQCTTSKSTDKWLNDSLSDLAQLSLAIEDWTRVCESFEPNDLNDVHAVKRMVTNLICLNKPGWNTKSKTMPLDISNDTHHCVHTRQ
ncbi:MAG: hypothetical protein AB8G95_20185 [Anaerolineae bacterium]